MVGVGQIHKYSFRRHTSHATSFGFALGPWGRFTAAKVFHQHANTDDPVEWKNGLSLK